MMVFSMMSVRFTQIMIALLFIPSTSWAITAIPISAELDISQARSHIITVTNQDTQATVPVKVEIYSWTHSETGEDIREPSNLIVAFPAQFAIKPGEQQKVRIAPRFKQRPEIEQTYRISVRQLPIDLSGSKKTQSGITLLTAYMTAFYITPKNPLSDIVLIKTIQFDKGIKFTLENKGNAHSHLVNLNLNISQNDHHISITDQEKLPDFASQNMHAGIKRIFTWEWPDALPDGFNINQDFNIELSFDCRYCAKTRRILSQKISK